MYRLMGLLAALTAFLAVGCIEAEDGVEGARSAVGGDNNICPMHENGCPDAGPPRGLCRVTGGGQIEWGDNPDSYGGNAQPFRSGVGGHWNHVSHDGHHFLGIPDDIFCFDSPGGPPDPPSAPFNTIVFSGVGSLNGETGCTFTVEIEDHGEPQDDHYEITVTCAIGSYYASNDVLHGNLQIHDIPPGHLPR